MSDDNRKWCWAPRKDSGTWYGPFDTREGALADVAAEILAGTLVNEDGLVLSRCNYADPADAAERWAESLEPLESLNDHTDEELQDYDDGETYMYEAGASDGVRAKRELSELIVAWTKRNVRTRWFSVDEDAKEVVKP